MIVAHGVRAVFDLCLEKFAGGVGARVWPGGSLFASILGYGLV